ncbi:MAG: recombinase family protein [Desulfobacterales bacterium]|nr:recombinase family protein [Desulfobacterales bacterium]
MKTAAIYCRVSTDNQESEGTSLQTQIEACLNYCVDKEYQVAYRLSEAYSGLTLERPKLNELRELIRNEQIDVVVFYCLDRLSRDPVQGVILTQELEKHHVALEAVTETVDSTEVGKLINYIKGFASKLEAEKIRERTMRGKKARAKGGRIPNGGFARAYGYDYIKVAHENGGRRVINENEAKWVCQIYNWLVNEGVSTTAITHRLRALNVPTKLGKPWIRQTVLGILKNPAYTGKTYAFTTLNGKRFKKAQDEWIEIPGVTPIIISQEVFEAAQKQLEINREKAKRNTKHEYLLQGHVYCRQCDRRYWGWLTTTSHNGKRYEWRRYRCSGSVKMVAPVNRCHNKSWGASKLEELVWTQIERVLDNPEFIIAEIEKQRQDANRPGVLGTELQQVERHLRGLAGEQEQLLQWALKGFPEDTVVAENKKINEKRESLKARKAELETQIKASQEAADNLPNLDRFVELMRQKLTTLDYETKRMALDMLGIKVWLAGHNVEITGALPITADVIVTTQSN